jgi:predicted short-subunit dehydrogenase-like oxidoreductase (DUF2520 family)
MAALFSSHVFHISSEERRLLHLAAVFSSNFTNHLLLHASHIMERLDLPFSLLNPLMKETLRKAFEIGPGRAQTGPAIRGDRETMQAHLELLKGDEQATRLYEILSRSIKDSLMEKPSLS